MLIGLLMVPLTLDYLNQEKYGVWLTLMSLVAWFNFFDVGLANGLRSKLAKTFANDDAQMARRYVSTAYAILSIIAILLFILFASTFNLYSWSGIFNVSPSMEDELRQLVFAVFFFFAIRFVITLITTILSADQKLDHAGLLDLVINALSLAAVFVTSSLAPPSLFLLGVMLSGIPVVVLLVASFWYFIGLYKRIAPSFKMIDFALTRDMASLSLQFFALQAMVLLIFLSNNIIIAQLLGPAEVSVFNVVYKYFSVATTVSILVLNPFWSAAAEAYHKGEMSWLRSSAKLLVKIWAGISLLGIFMLVASPFIYKLWLGNSIVISWRLSALMTLYVVVLAWHNSYIYLINGIGKIRLQLYVYILMGIIVIPLSYFLVKVVGMGVEGCVLSMILCLIPFSALAPVQFYAIINGKATGVFDK